jgi:TatD DNase family protein
MIPFIDIHTHFENTDAAVIAVLNHTQKEDFFITNTDTSNPKLETQNSKPKARNLKSVGLHPWFLTKDNFESDFKKISQHIENQEIIALGECGLDRLKGEDLVFQTQAFEAQIRLAETVQKPVIIHCVKAYNEVISLKKKLKPTIPLIVHGFNQNEIILKDLVKNGFYISLGVAVLRADSNAARYISQIPLNHLFFETDDKEVSITEIYGKSAKLLGMDLERLKSLVFQNFKVCFNLS